MSPAVDHQLCGSSLTPLAALARGGAARGLVREGERERVSGQNQLEEALVPSRAEERGCHLAVLQVRMIRNVHEAGVHLSAR